MRWWEIFLTAAAVVAFFSLFGVYVVFAYQGPWT